MPNRFDTIRIPSGNAHGLEPYEAGPELVAAANIAFVLKRPLLLMGEPGVGKTRMAEAIAYTLHPEAWKDYYYRWSVKSQSKAKDGLYAYDALLRLQDAQTKEAIPIERTEEFEKRYIRKRPFGEALERTSDPQNPAVLLIDEIDKADVDFPNDLLLELDEGKYVIEEINKPKTFIHKPFIIITSNHEKDLPIAFLRRCIFHYIELPSEAQMVSILKGRLAMLRKASAQPLRVEPSEEFFNHLFRIFDQIRTLIKNALMVQEKNVSTAELLDWFEVLFQHMQDDPTLEKKIEQALKTLEDSKKADLPYYQALLKNRQMYQQILSKPDHGPRA